MPDLPLAELNSSGADATSSPGTEARAVDAATLRHASDPASETEAADRRVLLHMPVDIRSASLALIALVLCLYALQWAREIVVPILCGVMMSYALTPVVDRMERWLRSRALAAVILLSAILALLGWGSWALGDQTDALIDTVPTVSAKVRALAQRANGNVSTLERVRKAATDLAAAAVVASAPASSSAPGLARTPAAAAPAAPVLKTAPPAGDALDVRTYLWSGTLGLLAFLGKVAVIFFVALFLLASGNSFRRKMVKLAGPKLSQKKVTVETMDEIAEQIQRYLLVQAAISVVVGIVTSMAFFLLGLQNAGVWGVVAAITNLIPYLGAVVVGVGSTIVALVQFGTPQMALLVGGTSFAIHTIVGNLITPWWMGRASKMSPVAVFISLLVFGWLWGVWGLLLGVPILLVVKSVCDRVDDLKPFGELIGA